jgi:1-deoxy-D-xylulose-5-phosphate synthase
MPNMTFLTPRDTTELREMARYMKDFNSGPIAVRYPRGASDESLPEQRTPIVMGRCEVLVKDPQAVCTIVAVGNMVSVAYQAQQEFATKGVKVNVVNARFIKPIDIATIAPLVKASGCVVTIEENARIGGFGEQLHDLLTQELGNSYQIDILALPDAFVEHGSQPILRDQVGLCSSNLIDRVLQLVKSQSRR